MKNIEEEIKNFAEVVLSFYSFCEDIEEMTDYFKDYRLICASTRVKMTCDELQNDLFRMLKSYRESLKNQ